MQNLEQKFSDLKNWIESNGGWINQKVTLTQTEWGRSVIATDTIMDEKIFTVPRHLTIKPENSGIVIDESIFGDFRERVIVSLLFEYHKPNSFWTPYLNLLPSLGEFSNHPQFLHYCGKFPKISESIYNMVDSSTTRLHDFIKKFKDYNDKINIVPICTDEEIIWAYFCVITRMWSEVGLVPFADLMQHSNQSSMGIIFEEKDLFMKGSFENGTQVYDNYCVDDDFTLFCNFGFVDNSQVCVIPTMFLFEERSKNLDVIVNGFLESSKIEKLKFLSFGINNLIMKYLRINFIDEMDLKTIDLGSNIGDQVISLNNELKCLKKIKFRLNVILSELEYEKIVLQKDTYDISGPEFQVWRLVDKIHNLKVSLDKFANDYWQDFLSDGSN
jgi:hypothetical protein